MVSLCSDHQDASNNVHFDIEVTFRSRDEVMIYVLTYFDAYQREDARW